MSFKKKNQTKFLKTEKIYLFILMCVNLWIIISIFKFSLILSCWFFCKNEIIFAKNISILYHKKKFKKRKVYQWWYKPRLQNEINISFYYAKSKYYFYKKSFYGFLFRNTQIYPLNILKKEKDYSLVNIRNSFVYFLLCLNGNFIKFFIPLIGFGLINSKVFPWFLFLFSQISTKKYFFETKSFFLNNRLNSLYFFEQSLIRGTCLKFISDLKKSLNLKFYSSLFLRRRKKRIFKSSLFFIFFLIKCFFKFYFIYFHEVCLMFFLIFYALSFMVFFNLYLDFYLI